MRRVELKALGCTNYSGDLCNDVWINGSDKPKHDPFYPSVLCVIEPLLNSSLSILTTCGWLAARSAVSPYRRLIAGADLTELRHCIRIDAAF